MITENVALDLVFIPFIGLLVDVVVQVAVFRLKGRSDLWGAVLTGFGAGAGVVTLMSVLTVSTLTAADAIGLVTMNIVSFVALGYGYFTFVNLNFTSLRIRMMRELMRAGGRGTEQELLSRYGAQEALMLRLERLKQKQQLVERNDRFYAGPANSFVVIANILDAFKWLLLGKRMQIPHR